MIYFLLNSFANLIIFSVCLALPANCQQNYDPNLGHFYMGRQQITIENNTPIINDRTSGTTSGGNAGLLNRPTPLPKSGWQPYAPIETPGINPNLPKVPTPVRQAHNAQASTGAGGKKAHAGNLAAAAHGKSASPNGIRSYSPYAQYPAPAPNTQAAEELGRSTRVKGSLLHWARRAPKEQ